MRAIRVFHRILLSSCCLLFVAGCAGNLFNSPTTDNDTSLPQPVENSSPALSAAPSPPAFFAAPAPPETPPSRKTVAPLETLSGTPVTTSSGASLTAAQEDSAASGSNTGFDNVELVTPRLATRLAILRAGSDHTEDGLLTVFVGLKNKTARTLQIEVDTIYKDKSGQLLTEGKENWIPLKLKPYQEFQYRSVAISEDAADFLVRIRRMAPQHSGQ
ncbi:MAG TPA: DUF1425 domain-containing protein [Candidatus Methylacidiphilales bacterium]|nr:DUF1425 domain-containing protein [Candidatus Methylacidiphilales bacterium]